jgi:nicotinate-nucleotide pyrophosphorylase (carboxylating)
LADLDPFLREFRMDTAGGDRTTAALGLHDQRGAALLRARQPLTPAGLALIEALPTALHLDLVGDVRAADGKAVPAGATLARLQGALPDLLALERTLLNALQWLSGIATETAAWVAALPAGVTLLDTRKTHPGLRAWERLAFRAGGGCNHRFNLADAIMLKDNHIAAVGSAQRAVELAVAACPPGVRVTCEVESIEEALAAVAAGAGALLIDNEPPAHWPLYWDALPAHVNLEFSGGVVRDTLAAIPQPPRPIWISSSRPVMAAQAVDIGLDSDA